MSPKIEFVRTFFKKEWTSSLHDWGSTSAWFIFSFYFLLSLTAMNKCTQAQRGAHTRTHAPLSDSVASGKPGWLKSPLNETSPWSSTNKHHLLLCSSHLGELGWGWGTWREKGIPDLSGGPLLRGPLKPSRLLNQTRPHVSRDVMKAAEVIETSLPLSKLIC